MFTSLNSPPLTQQHRQTIRLEGRRVQRHDTEQTRDETSSWQSVHPASEDEEDLAPVDSLDVVIHDNVCK